MTVGNGERYHKARHRHNQLACLLHESYYCNHRLAPDFRDQTAGLAAWLLHILFMDTPFPTQLWFLLRGFPQKGPTHLCGVSP